MAVLQTEECDTLAYVDVHSGVNYGIKMPNHVQQAALQVNIKPCGFLSLFLVRVREQIQCSRRAKGKKNTSCSKPQYYRHVQVCKNDRRTHKANGKKPRCSLILINGRKASLPLDTTLITARRSLRTIPTMIEEPAPTAIRIYPSCFISGSFQR